MQITIQLLDKSGQTILQKTQACQYSLLSSIDAAKAMIDRELEYLTDNQVNSWSHLEITIDR